MYTYQPLRDSIDWEPEKQADELLRARPRPPKRQWHSALVTCTYALVALAALSVVIVEMSRLRQPVSLLIPQFDTEVRSLRPMPSYEQPANEESNYLWESDVPHGQGFVTIADAAAHGLPTGLLDHDNATTKYGITWAHEYHCLDMMRRAFWGAIDGNSTLYGGDAADPPLSDSDKKQLEHVSHCFNYLRQLIMCRADMTIEWAAPHHNAHGQQDTIDGYGIPHTCVKFDEVSEWMSTHAAMPSEHHHHG